MEPRIAPGQRINAKQLAARMGRSLDYVYRHARRWPFTVREGRAVAFDEAGYVRWQRTKQRAAPH
jgi:predicted DNA-binding transcriptional regulator AlpA